MKEWLFFFREEKEHWIRAKYESKEMLCDLPPSDFSLGEVSGLKFLISVRRNDHAIAASSAESYLGI